MTKNDGGPELPPDNLVIWHGVTRHDLPPDRILDAAKERGLESVVIMGYDENGEQYFASSVADGGTVLWIMEKAKKALMEVDI